MPQKNWQVTSMEHQARCEAVGRGRACDPKVVPWKVLPGMGAPGCKIFQLFEKSPNSRCSCETS